MPRIYTSVDTELLDRFRSEARRRRMQYARLLREALVAYLGIDGQAELRARIAELEARVAELERGEDQTGNGGGGEPAGAADA